MQSEIYASRNIYKNRPFAKNVNIFPDANVTLYTLLLWRLVHDYQTAIGKYPACKNLFDFFPFLHLQKPCQENNVSTTS